MYFESKYSPLRHPSRKIDFDLSPDDCNMHNLIRLVGFLAILGSITYIGVKTNQSMGYFVFTYFFISVLAFVQYILLFNCSFQTYLTPRSERNFYYVFAFLMSFGIVFYYLLRPFLDRKIGR